MTTHDAGACIQFNRSGATWCGKLLANMLDWFVSIDHAAGAPRRVCSDCLAAVATALGLEKT